MLASKCMVVLLLRLHRLVAIYDLLSHLCGPITSTGILTEKGLLLLFVFYCMQMLYLVWYGGQRQFSETKSPFQPCELFCRNLHQEKTFSLGGNLIKSKDILKKRQGIPSYRETP